MENLLIKYLYTTPILNILTLHKTKRELTGFKFYIQLQSHKKNGTKIKIF